MKSLPYQLASCSQSTCRACLNGVGPRSQPPRKPSLPPRVGAQRVAAADPLAQFKDTTLGGPNTNRVWVGSADDGSATVALMDIQGRRRIVMEVKADGGSSLTFLDANGKVLNQLVPSGVRP